jgi:hypothetical protein
MLTSAEREDKKAEFRKALREEAARTLADEGSSLADVARARLAVNKPDFKIEGSGLPDSVCTVEEANLLFDVIEEFYQYIANFGFGDR